MQRKNVTHLQLRRFVIRNSKNLVFVFMIIHIREKEREREVERETMKVLSFTIS